MPQRDIMDGNLTICGFTVVDSILGSLGYSTQRLNETELDSKYFHHPFGKVLGEAKSPNDFSSMYSHLESVSIPT
jgi:hypothetical protein